MRPSHHTAVIGRGGVGSAALFWSAKRGDPGGVIGFDREVLGHDRGASDDHSRIIRRAQHQEPYATLANDAYRTWAEVERESGQQLIVRTGGLVIEAVDERRDLDTGTRTIDGYAYLLRQHGVPYELLSPAEVGERWPQFRLDGTERTIYQADSGLVDARRATATHLALARVVGAEVRTRTPVRALRPRSAGIEVVTDTDVTGAEMERVWASGWLFAGLSAELPAPGDTLTWSPGSESMLLIRGDDGVIRAFHNVCRHRGCRLLAEGTANLRRVMCPYHPWTYGRDGALRSAWGTGAEVAPDELSLVPLPVRDVGGLLFVSFDPEPPSLAAAEDAIVPQLAPHQVQATQVAHRASYTVHANWKVLVENNRECYHCRGNHPEFCVSNYELGGAGDVRTNPEYERETRRQEARWAAAGLSPRVVSFPGGDFFRIARLPLRPGFVTESMSGRRVAPRLGTLTTDDTGSVRLIFLPNAWAHLNCDYVMTTRPRPVTVDQTDVDVCFLVKAGAQEGQDYDLAGLTHVWTATSEQDWALCEANYAGIRCRGYRPGPLSSLTESAIGQFYEWYLGRLSADPVTPGS